MLLQYVTNKDREYLSVTYCSDRFEIKCKIYFFKYKLQKYQEDKPLKKHLLWVSLCSMALVLSACESSDAKKETEVNKVSEKQEKTSEKISETEQENESQTEKETEKEIEQIAKIPEIKNNGKTVVQYGSDLYYWKYNNGSFEHQALLANYHPVSTAQNELICQKEDGNEEVVLSACAMGNLFILNDRLYFESLSFTEYTYNTEVKWIEQKNGKWDTSVINSLGIGKIAAVDKEKNVILFLTQADGSQYNDLYIIHPEKPEEKTAVDQKVLYLAYENGIIYYQKETEDIKKGQRGEISLWAADLQLNKTELVHTNPDLYDFEDGGKAEVQCLQVFDGDIYFSYGNIAGTGHFYQGGNICKIPVGGGNCEVLANSAEDLFYVYQQNGEVKIEQAKKLGEPYWDEAGNYYMYIDTEGTLVTLISSNDYINDQTAAVRINDIEQIGNQVFYKIVYSTYNAEISMGWRDGYDWNKTEVYTRNIHTGEVKKLYEY